MAHDWSSHAISEGHHWPALTLFNTNLPDWRGQMHHVASDHQYPSNIHCVLLQNSHVFDCNICGISCCAFTSIMQWSRRHFHVCNMLVIQCRQCFIPLLSLVWSHRTFSVLWLGGLPVAIWPWFEPITGTYFYMLLFRTVPSRSFAVQIVICFPGHIASSSCTLWTVASDTLSKLQTTTSSSHIYGHWFYTVCWQ